MEVPRVAKGDLRLDSILFFNKIGQANIREWLVVTVSHGHFVKMLKHALQLRFSFN
jgi:hypothetical protein